MTTAPVFARSTATPADIHFDWADRLRLDEALSGGGAGGCATASMTILRRSSFRGCSQPTGVSISKGRIPQRNQPAFFKLQTSAAKSMAVRQASANRKPPRRAGVSTPARIPVGRLALGQAGTEG